MQMSTADICVDMYPTRLMLAVLVTLLCIGCAAKDRTSDIKQVQTDVRKLVGALYENKLDDLLSFTHPALIEALGGTSLAKERLQETISMMQEKGMKLESLDFPASPTFLESRGPEYVIVPTLTVISANGQRLESLNYQIGTRSTESSDWKYVEGSRINKDNVQKIFPGFPPDYSFPPSYRKKLE